MDSIKEKDVSIKVRNTSNPHDPKANEVSLAEVENNDGYQYIQIKNSETLNNTKGLETENPNDGILFKKLNETQNTTTKEMEETEEDPESINNVNDSELADESYNQNENNIKIKMNNNKNKTKNNFDVYNDNYNYYNKKKPKSSRNKNPNYINMDNEDDNDNDNNNEHKGNKYNKENENDYQNINVNNYLRDNSDRLNDQSEREFFEKVIVRNEETYEELTSENYSISVCPKVTTVKFDGETFSFLTNPTSDENFFYLKLNQNSFNFDLCDLDEYKRNYLDTTRIPYNQLLGFVTEINMGLQGLKKEVGSKRFWIRFWNVVKVFATCVVLAAAAYLLFFYGEKFFGISANANMNIFYGISCMFAVFVFFLIYLFSQDLTLNYEICKIHLERQRELEEIVEKWNQEYFGPNLNMNCSIPYTFPYIQITLQPNLLIYLEEHEIFD